MPSKTFRTALVCAVAAFWAADAVAQIDARMLRYPAVSKDRIAFGMPNAKCQSR